MTPRAKKIADSTGLARAIADTLIDKKCESIRIIDLRKLSDLADYIVIGSAQSKRHLKNIGEELVGELKEAKIGRFRVEGLKSDSWVVVDLFDVIVHVFMPDRRNYFAL